METYKTNARINHSESQALHGLTMIGIVVTITFMMSGALSFMNEDSAEHIAAWYWGFYAALGSIYCVGFFIWDEYDKLWRNWLALIILTSLGLSVMAFVRFQGLILFLLIINLSCSKEFATDKPENVLKKLSQTDKAVEKNKYYSKDTLKVINNALSKGLLTESDKKYLLHDLDSKIEWELLKSNVTSEVSERKAQVVIKYTNHPVENMIGFNMLYNFIIENGKWKIDLKNELENALALVKKSDHAKYLNNIRAKNTVK